MHASAGAGLAPAGAGVCYVLLQKPDPLSAPKALFKIFERFFLETWILLGSHFLIQGVVKDHLLEPGGGGEGSRHPSYCIGAVCLRALLALASRQHHLLPFGAPSRWRIIQAGLRTLLLVC